MWCTHCRQDVPALPSPGTGGLCCPRCAEEIGGARATEAAAAGYDGWELDEQLRHIGRVLQTDKSRGDDAAAACRREADRFDFPHADLPRRHAAGAKRRNAPKIKRSSGAGALIWCTLSLGTTSFVCGGILLGWSMATGRQELWTIGLPAALGGQIALVVGLVLQLDRLWHDNREAVTKLDNVDEQLHELKTTTTLLSTSHGPTASVFYSHFAGGAGPRLLLTDLKSQIDLLAMKIAQDER